MGKLRELAVRSRHANIPESDRMGDRVDRGPLSGEEVPACGSLRTAVALQVKGLLLRRLLRRLAGIDADDDDIEVLARRELHHLERAGKTVQPFGAEHGAAVVDKRNHGGWLAP